MTTPSATVTTALERLAALHVHALSIRKAGAASARALELALSDADRAATVQATALRQEYGLTLEEVADAMDTIPQDARLVEVYAGELFAKGDYRFLLAANYREAVAALVARRVAAGASAPLDACFIRADGLCMSPVACDHGPGWVLTALGDESRPRANTIRPQDLSLVAHGSYRGVLTAFVTPEGAVAYTFTGDPIREPA